jgi:hypothetical protein
MRSREEKEYTYKTDSATLLVRSFNYSFMNNPTKHTYIEYNENATNQMRPN